MTFGASSSRIGPERTIPSSRQRVSPSTRTRLTLANQRPSKAARDFLLLSISTVLILSNANTSVAATSDFSALTTPFRVGFRSALASTQQPKLWGNSPRRAVSSRRKESNRNDYLQPVNSIFNVRNRKQQVQDDNTEYHYDNFDDFLDYEVPNENSVATDAFFESTNEFDNWYNRNVQAAFLQRPSIHPAAADKNSHIQTSRTSSIQEELEFLESSIGRSHEWVPASLRRVVASARPRQQPPPVKEEEEELRLTQLVTNVIRSAEEEADIDNIEEVDQLLSKDPRIQKTLACIPPNLRAGAAAALVAVATRPLAFWESMICGAVSRSVAQTTMHPANTMKTILQSTRKGTAGITISELMKPHNFRMLTRGAGANFILSVPHGAINFAVLEFVRKQLGTVVARTPFLARNENKFSAGLDFLSSAISTITCSVVSTPQMMVTDNIMAGNYPNLPAALKGLAENRGIRGFYAGWWPGLVGKIPSYALTWTLFQQLKAARDRISNRPATDWENSVMGCMASATTVCIMIPMDTIKTRLVTQAGKSASEQAYKGIIDCAVRIAKEEGMGTFYRGLPPRLVSVVPMIGIQFGVYEFMKKVMLKRKLEVTRARLDKEYGRDGEFQEALMEVAASPEHPYPAPHFSQGVKPEAEPTNPQEDEEGKQQLKEQPQTN